MENVARTQGSQEEKNASSGGDKKWSDLLNASHFKALLRCAKSSEWAVYY